MSDRAIRSVAILGGGITGLSAALAFARALPQIAVTLVETPPDPAALADRLPGSTTAIHRFHASMGIEEQALVRAGIAVPRLGLRFDDWPADGESWYHVHGDHGPPGGAIAFHQLWARARREGRAGAWHLYGAAGVLAEAGRFVHPQGKPGTPLATFDYALRLDPERYRQTLTALADRLRVTRRPGAFGGIERREDGGASALLLTDGSRIEADLYFDASGPSAPLAEAMGGSFEDWSDSLPCDRVALAAAPSGAFGPNDRITGTARGWHFAAALPGGTLLGEIWSADRGGHDEGAVAIRPGRRAAPWVRNTLALGDAAVALDPLHWPNLHLAHSGIARALELLPGRDFHPVEVAEYNRRAREEAERMRDFQALHYLHKSGDAASLRVPASLAHTLQQFASRGRLPAYDEDSLPKEIWLSALLGLGVLPRAIEPLASGVPADVVAARMAEMRAGLAQLPARLPSYAEYLARCGVPKD